MNKNPMQAVADLADKLGIDRGQINQETLIQQTAERALAEINTLSKQRDHLLKELTAIANCSNDSTLGGIRAHAVKIVTGVGNV